METLEWNTTDKSTWGDGPWQNEPDKKQWLDQETGLPCLIVRGPSGALCGYVGLSKGHPLYEKDYDDVYVEVHGGLTFADHCQPNKEGICHIVESNEDDNVWWLGFDCAHGGDIMPKHNALYDSLFNSLPTFKRTLPEEYRTLEYVENECKSLARQLKDLAP